LINFRGFASSKGFGIFPHTKNVLLVKWGGGALVGIDEGETCPAGLKRGIYALGGWLGQVRLAINTLLIKRGVGWEKWKIFLRGVAGDGGWELEVMGGWFGLHWPKDHVICIG